MSCSASPARSTRLDHPEPAHQPPPSTVPQGTARRRAAGVRAPGQDELRPRLPRRPAPAAKDHRDAQRETTNTLRRRIAFANRNELRHDADPDQHAACLTLILNAIIVWNTRYIQAALDDIRHARPEPVTDQALARLAPVLHAHINPYGRYRFDLTSAPDAGQLRPLNAASAGAPNDVPSTPIPVNRD